MKEATVALKNAKVINDHESVKYASTREPNNPNGPYLSLDHESSDDTDDTDSD